MSQYPYYPPPQGPSYSYHESANQQQQQFPPPPVVQPSPLNPQYVYPPPSSNPPPPPPVQPNPYAPPPPSSPCYAPPPSNYPNANLYQFPPPPQPQVYPTQNPSSSFNYQPQDPYLQPPPPQNPYPYPSSAPPPQPFINPPYYSDPHAPGPYYTVPPPTNAPPQQGYYDSNPSSSSYSPYPFPPPQQPQPQQPPPPFYGFGSPLPPQAPPPVSPYGPMTNAYSYQGTTYTASSCQGNKKALLIGINYTGTRAELKGCVNDVRNISAFLSTHFGFSKASDKMRILTDESQSSMLPTKANIVASIKWLIGGAVPGDSLFFQFSGHGGQQDDMDGDEADGKDETILPLDYNRAGMISDDELNALMVRPLPPGVRLTCIFDSCHSGTVLDLPFLYNCRGEIIPQHHSTARPDPLKHVEQALLSGNLFTAALSLLDAASSTPSKPNVHAQRITEQTRGTNADVIMFSGCRDDQTSADAYEAGFGRTGAMSYAFIRSLSANKHQTYLQLLGSMRDLLRGKYTQVPQLSTGRYMDMSSQFVM